MKYHLKFKKVLATDALDRLTLELKDGMGTPVKLCSILCSLGIDCTVSDLKAFLESIGSFCDDDGQYSWFELVSFLQPHSHFESTCTLLSWHMQCLRKDSGASQTGTEHGHVAARTPFPEIEITNTQAVAAADDDSFRRRLRLYQHYDARNFWRSAKSGVLQSVMHHVEDMEQPISERDNFDNTAIYYACLCGHTDIVAYLLNRHEQGEHHLSPDERDRCTTNALNAETKLILQQHRKCHFSYQNYQERAAKRKQQKAEDEANGDNDESFSGFAGMFGDGDDAGY